MGLGKIDKGGGINRIKEKEKRDRDSKKKKREN